MTASLKASERRFLLELARETIRHHLNGKSVEVAAHELSDALKREAGAFVTLTVQRELRGCIGSVVAVDPLYRNVQQNAVNAATRDPRFPPLSLHEFGRMAVEISVMSPIEPVRDLDEIEVGRDGLIVRRGFRSGLLLPQVATEYGWDRETFLSHTCRKAGLPMDDWRRAGLEIEKFSAEVFGEGD